jgi:hypothetical protein
MEYGGSKFYHDVWKNWKTISSVNNLNVWKQLEEGLDEFVKEKNLDVLHIAKPNGIIPTISKIDLLVTIKREVYQPTVFIWKGKSALNKTNHGRKRGHCCTAMMMKRRRTLVLTRKQGDQGEILSLVEIAPTLSVKTAAVICLLKMRKFKMIKTSIVRTPTILVCNNCVYQRCMLGEW